MDLTFQIRQLLKISSQKVILPAAYRLFSFWQVLKKAAGKTGEAEKNRVILLADAHHNTCPESMKLVEQELKKRAGKEHLTILEQYLDYGSAGPLRTTVHMIRFMRLYAASDAVVLSDNFLPASSCKKKPSTKVVQLWHACGALKKFGYDTTEDIPASYSGHVYANLDVVTVSAPAAARPFAGAMRLPQKVMKPLGVSRTDRFFDPQFLQNCREAFARTYPRSRGRKVVLWAPTFRGNAARTRNISLDVKQLEKELGDGCFVVSSLHPHMNAEKGSRKPGLSTLEMLPAADVLAADYSSLVYEYMLLKKALVLYVPDLEQYRQERGFYMDPEELPALIVQEEEKLADTIREAVSGGGYAGEACDAFLKKWMSGCDGHATERIVQEILSEAGSQET